jgi:hypothetical protein
MRQLIDALREIQGQDVNIYTKHKLFGDQRLRTKFKPEIEMGIGFHYKEQAIYIDKSEIVDYCIEDDKIVINGEMMSMAIIKDI